MAVTHKKETLMMDGLNFDRPKFATPPNKWTDGFNVQMEDLTAKRVRGMQQTIVPPLTVPWHLRFTRLAGVSKLIYAGPTNVYQFDGTTHTNITQAGYVSPIKPSDITSAVLNGLPLLNVRGNVPAYWNRNPATPFVALPGLIAGEKYDMIAAFRYNIFGLGVNDGVNYFPDKIRWSASADPGNVPSTWTPANTNDAGSFPLAASEGEIISSIVYRDQLFIFKRNYTYAISFVGGRFIYSPRTISSSIGCLTTDGVCVCGDLIYLITDGDVVKTDGTSFQSVISDEMRRYLFESVDPINYEKAFLVANEATKDVWICFPTAGATDCDRAIVVNHETGLASVRELPNVVHADFGLVGGGTSPTWNADSASWDSDPNNWQEAGNTSAAYYMLFAAPSRVTEQQIIRAEFGLTYLGGDIESRLARHQLTLGESSRSKTVYRIRPLIEAVGNVELFCRVGVQDDLNEPITWDAWQSAPFPGTDDFDMEIAGKYISVEFYSTDSVVWSLQGFEITYRMGGVY